MDEHYLQFLAWLSGLTDGDLALAMLYGIISGGLVTGGYVWFVRTRRKDRAAQLRAKPSRYVRLRAGR